MNRLPAEFRRTPPSPRTLSVTRIPRTDGGHTIPVGWNWTNSMLTSPAPAWSASECPSPVYSHELEVSFQGAPAPPGGGPAGPAPGAPPRCAVALPGLPDAAGGQHDRRRLPGEEPPRLAPVAERAGDPLL